MNGANAKQKVSRKRLKMSKIQGMIPPGSTIGILGGGQLGRMISIAAAQLGYSSHIFSPDKNNPASQVSAKSTTAEFENTKALTSFAKQSDVITLEFENIPRETLQFLSSIVPVRPSATVLSVIQNRLSEKRYLKSIDVETADFEPVNNLKSLEQAVEIIGLDSILKSAEFGYDGKGQVVIDAGTDHPSALRLMGSENGILEKKIDFECEISVIVARNPLGNMAVYDPGENRHVQQILDTTIVPVPLSKSLISRAIEIAKHIADQLQVIGLLAVEMFITRQGNVLVNELAPRPHNSGHWTIDACQTSQFEQLVRAITGLPLGSTERRANVVMKNLIGNEVESWLSLVEDPNLNLHLYGKTEVRPGRKMGHFTRLFPIDTNPDI